MKDNIFVDSNVILYTLGKEKSKKEKAKDLVRKNPFESVNSEQDGHQSLSSIIEKSK
jgi:predicted nucleic acid-binding protein